MSFITLKNLIHRIKIVFFGQMLNGFNLFLFRFLFTIIENKIIIEI